MSINNPLLKKLLFIFSLCLVYFGAFAQADTGNVAAHKAATDTVSSTVQHAAVKKSKKIVVADSNNRRGIADTFKVKDSTTAVDSLSAKFSDTAKLPVADTAKKSALPLITKKPFDSIYRRLLDNPFISKAKPIYLVIDEREIQSKDQIFYLICGLLIFLAFIRLAFSRYFKNIFKLFFQPSFRQKQTREQLVQSNLPSLLLNLFFIFSAGTYVAFLLQYSHLIQVGFWLLLLYTNIALLALYLGKFIFLSFAGWVFDVREATGAYIFSVYLINKILGVVLVPFILLVAFSEPAVANVSITISVLVVLLLYLYRYMVSYAPVRREVKVSLLHFLLYICAFEIMPLLLIYKTLIIFLDNSS